MKVCVYIGRFQPFHCGHLAVLRKALTDFDRVIMVLGSCNYDRDLTKNPWEFQERVLMILGSLTKAECERIHFIKQTDTPGQNDAWVRSVVYGVERIVNIWERKLECNIDIFLTGCKKDDSSFYLDLLPWEFVPAPPHGIINATDIRAKIAGRSKFEIAYQEHGDGEWGEHLTYATRLVIKASALRAESDRLFGMVENLIPIPPYSGADL